MQTPFYDPTKSYYDNFKHGPSGDLADGKKIKRRGNPKFKFLGHKVYTPFGIPAGPLPNSLFISACFEKGFDICTYKTVRSREYPCHPTPNVLAVKVTGNLTLKKAKKQLVATDDYSEPLSITNSFGVPSMEPDWWQADMAKAVKTAGKGQIMVGSFQGTKSADGNPQKFIDDYALAAKLVKETGAPILEANLSCPNEGTGDLVCFDVKRVTGIAEAIKNEIGNTPLILKMAYFESDEHLEKFVKAVGPVVQALSAINTIPAAIVDRQGKQALPGEGRLVSGVCGASIKWAGVEMVGRLQKLREKLGLSFTIIGVGGVMNATDFNEYRQAGADAVQSATGAMWNPYLGEEIYAVC